MSFLGKLNPLYPSYSIIKKKDKIYISWFLTNWKPQLKDMIGYEVNSTDEKSSIYLNLFVQIQKDPWTILKDKDLLSLYSYLYDPQIFINIIYAINGQNFKKDKWIIFFNLMNWYTNKNINVSMNELPEDQRDILAFLTNIEKIKKPNLSLWNDFIPTLSKGKDDNEELIYTYLTKASEANMLAQLSELKNIETELNKTYEGKTIYKNIRTWLQICNQTNESLLKKINYYKFKSNFENKIETLNHERLYEYLLELTEENNLTKAKLQMGKYYSYYIELVLNTLINEKNYWNSKGTLFNNEKYKKLNEIEKILKRSF